MKGFHRQGGGLDESVIQELQEKGHQIRRIYDAGRMLLCKIAGYLSDCGRFPPVCGLNCGLCPMYLNKNCLGCGCGEENHSCKIARCSMEHNGIEYCFQCNEYPCEKYEKIDKFDSFISHRNQKSDLEKARQIGIEAYNAEQEEKVEILGTLLAGEFGYRHRSLMDSEELRIEVSSSKCIRFLERTEEERCIFGKRVSAYECL